MSMGSGREMKVMLLRRLQDHALVMILNRVSSALSNTTVSHTKKVLNSS
jgi:hypothetical protein